MRFEWMNEFFEFCEGWGYNPYSKLAVIQFKEYKKQNYTL